MKRLALAAAIAVVAPFVHAQDKGPALPKPGPITAPAGVYKLDTGHASLTWKVMHFGLSQYTARFTKFDATLNLDPKDMTKSSIELTVDPNSVETDFPGDYKATHKDSPFATFDEALAKGDKFFDSGKYPTISFKSTKVVPQGKGKLKITGDLTYRGVTKPLTLDATVVGSIAKHPWTGGGAIGFSATGKMKRSEWGHSDMIPVVGDDVQLIFEGEFQQAKN